LDRRDKKTNNGGEKREACTRKIKTTQLRRSVLRAKGGAKRKGTPKSKNFPRVREKEGAMGGKNQPRLSLEERKPRKDYLYNSGSGTLGRLEKNRRKTEKHRVLYAGGK